MKLRTLGLLAAVLAAGLWGASAKAATLEVAVQEDGGAITLVAGTSGIGFTPISYSGTFGDFTITLLGSSSDNGANLSDLLSATTSVKNNSGSAHTLAIYVTETDYTLPSASTLTMKSGLSGTEASGTVGLNGIFQAYFNSNDSLFGVTATNNPQNAVLTNTTFDTGTVAGGFSNTGTYSLTSVATLALSANAQVNISDSVTVAAPVPAAAWMGLSTLAGLAGLGMVRRRRSA